MLTGRKTVHKEGFGPKCEFLFPKIGWRQRVGAYKKFDDKSFSSAFSPEKLLRWLNTVLRAVSGNLRDGASFKLDKQTWRRKSIDTQKPISQNLLIKIL